MYKVLADDKIVIYDSSLADNKLISAVITKEINKSGSFVFSIYPDHFFYDNFVRHKTVITVYKLDKIIFRGRVLSDTGDYFNKKTITCEGELGFFNDSVIRPYDYTGTPEELLKQLVDVHNQQVDDFKRFKIGTVTVVDPNDYIIRSNEAYDTTFKNLTAKLIESQLGGYFYITHGEDGTDPIPTINYLADLTNECTQSIEFGKNLRDYARVSKSEDFCTALLPLGATIETEDSEATNERVTIKDVNNGLDFIVNEKAVTDYGFILKTVEFSDITEARNLLRKAELYLIEASSESMTLELKAVDLNLLDRNIESFNLGDLIRVTSQPHNIDRRMLCNKISIDLLNPGNDEIALGDTLKTYTQAMATDIKNLGQNLNAQIKTDIVNMQKTAKGLYETLVETETGGQIVYLHDKPILENSTVLLRVSTEGVEVSSDQGKTWFGLLVNGDMIANIIQAGGVVVNGEIHATSGTLENMTIVDGITVSRYDTFNDGYIEFPFVQITDSETDLGNTAYTITFGVFSYDSLPMEFFCSMMSINAPRGVNISTDQIVTDGIISTSASVATPTIYVDDIYQNYSSDGIYLRSGVNIGSTYGHQNGYWLSCQGSAKFQGTVATGSDRKLKKDIVSIKDDSRYIDFIMSLDPVSFKRVDGDSGRTHLGFIAQDVAEETKKIGNLSIASATTLNDNGEWDYYDETQKDDNQNWCLNYTSLIAPLTAFVQQQQKTIEDLTKRIETLEAEKEDKTE